MNDVNILQRYTVKSVISYHFLKEKSMLYTPKIFNTQLLKNKKGQGFPGGTVVKNPPANAGDTGSSPGPGRSHMPWSN